MEESRFRKSKIDLISTRITNQFKFFKKGFGDPAFLNRIPHILLDANNSPSIPEISWKKEKKIRKVLWRKGEFKSPFSEHLPTEAQTAHLAMISPLEMTPDTPILIHFAMTGDQGYLKRLLALGLPLVRDGIASVILEIPYYGIRKPEDQFHIFINTVADFFKMCGGTIVEGLGLLNYFKLQGYRKLGVTGVSMGGNITCFVTSLYKGKLASIPCLAPPSPGPVFLEGMLKGSVHWKNLAEEIGSSESARDRLGSLFHSTSLHHFPVPVSADKTIFVAGDADGIVTPDSVEKLHRYWVGSELRWVKGGHVRSIFGKTGYFREAIRDSFQKLDQDGE